MNAQDFTKEVRRRLASTSTRLQVIRHTSHIKDRSRERAFSDLEIRKALEKGQVGGFPRVADVSHTGWVASYYWRSPDGHPLELMVNLPDNNQIVIAITGWRKGR